MSESDYTGYRPIIAEGARIGIAVCKRCGAAICLDPQDTFDSYALHDEWHEAEAARHEQHTKIREAAEDLASHWESLPGWVMERAGTILKALGEDTPPANVICEDTGFNVRRCHCDRCMPVSGSEPHEEGAQT